MPCAYWVRVKLNVGETGIFCRSIFFYIFRRAKLNCRNIGYIRSAGDTSKTKLSEKRVHFVGDTDKNQLSEKRVYFVGDTGITVLSEKRVVGDVDLSENWDEHQPEITLSERWEVHLRRKILSEVRIVGEMGCRRSGVDPGRAR